MKSRRLRNLISIAAALSVGACVGGNEADEVVERMTFDEYVASLPRDGSGAYVVEGDIRVRDKADLTDYYAATFLGQALILDQDSSAVDHKYTATRALDLSYCVSTAFGANHDLVRDTFAAAALEWQNATEIVAGDGWTVRFTYRAVEDTLCTNANTRVWFNIIPDPSMTFDADSFYPNYTRPDRELRITPVAFTPYHAQTLTGVMRHEIGHILGFRHEHIAALTCNGEDTTWRPLTPYDIPSVMHYRQSPSPVCGSSGITDYTLTTHDNAGARCVYTTQSRGAADTAGDACRALTSLSTATSTTTFAINTNGPGDVYRLVRTTAADGTVTSTIARYVAPTTTVTQTWTTLWSAAEPGASATTGIFAGGSQLYRRTATGIFRWTGAAWSALAGNQGSSVVVAYNTGDLFRLNIAANGLLAGSISRFVAGSTVATPILTGGAAGRKLFAGTSDLFRLDSNGSLFQWTTAGWSAAAIGTGIKAAAKTANGSIFALLTDAAGTVMLRGSAGAWTTIGTGSSALWGGLEVPYASMIDNTATALDESKIIRRNPSGATWRKYALSSKSIMKGGTRRIAINTNNRPYFYETP